MPKLIAAILSVVVLTISAGVVRAETERRIALVIGNDAYEIPALQLKNATADARDIGKALTAAGFETTVKTNVRRRELYQLIDAFAAKIAGSPDTVGLFYYAGHGVQASGKNYLIPVDAAVESEADLEAEAVDAGKVLRAMDEAHNRVNIVILDACRDNPLPKGRSLSRGLTPMEAPRGTFIGYAAAPGQTALDGEPGSNGIFTGVLVKQLAVPGLPIEDVFKRVIAGVQERTGGKQVPWMESSLQGNFYFFAPITVNEAPPGSDAEIVFWQSIAGSTNAADFEEYLRQYPGGHFAALAHNRLATLQTSQQQALAPTLPAPQVSTQPKNLDDIPKDQIAYIDISRLTMELIPYLPALGAQTDDQKEKLQLLVRSVIDDAIRNENKDRFMFIFYIKADIKSRLVLFDLSVYGSDSNNIRTMYTDLTDKAKAIALHHLPEISSVVDTYSRQTKVAK
jgi:hypothetical protein